jgi:hypothetical protein
MRRSKRSSKCRLASPVVSDVAIDWDGCDVQTLAELPPVFDGDVMTVFGRAPARVPKQVTLSCRTPAGPRSWTVPVGHSEDLGGVIPLMWARRTIQSMEEVNEVPRSRAAKPTREQEMLVSISKQFGLVCGLTSFIAVEHRSLEERNEGKPALRRVPTALAAEWGDVLGELSAGGAASCASMSYRAAPPPAPAQAAPVDRCLDKSIVLGDILGDVAPAARRRASTRGGFFSGLASRVRSASDDDERPAGPPPSPVQAILARQTAAGWFEWDDSLVGKNELRRRLEDAVADWFGGLPDLKVVATIAALVRLRAAHHDERDLWRRAERKALRWLVEAVNRPQADVAAWLDALARDPQLSSAANR